MCFRMCRHKPGEACFPGLCFVGTPRLGGVPEMNEIGAPCPQVRRDRAGFEHSGGTIRYTLALSGAFALCQVGPPLRRLRRRRSRWPKFRRLHGHRHGLAFPWRTGRGREQNFSRFSTLAHVPSPVAKGTEAVAVSSFVGRIVRP